MLNPGYDDFAKEFADLVNGMVSVGQGGVPGGSFEARVQEGIGGAMTAPFRQLTEEGVRATYQSVLALAKKCGAESVSIQGGFPMGFSVGLSFKVQQPEDLR